MIYILDNNLTVLGTLTSHGTTNKVTTYFEDTLVRDLETGAETITFSTYTNSPQASNLRVGNYVALLEDDEYKLFQITETTERHSDELITEVYCEMAGIELLTQTVAPFYSASINAKQLLTNILASTDFSVGYVDSQLSDTYEINQEEYTKVYNVIQDIIIGTFGAEINYRTEIKGGRVVGKYIDLYKQRGNFNGFRFDYDTNMVSVERKIDSSELITACIGVGNNGITFRDIEAEDKPLGQDFIADEQSYFLWNKKGNHIMDVVSFDTDSEAELLNLTRKELNRRKTPYFTYTLDVETLGQKVKLGDTVYVVDNSFNPPLHLSARVSKLTTSRTDKEQNKCELSNYKAVKSKIASNSYDGSIEDLINSKFPVTSSDIANGAVTSDKVSAGAIGTGHIQEGAITSDLILAGQIKAEHILAEAIKAGHIEAGSITADKIGVNEINANHLQANVITSEKINAEAILSEHIKANQIVGSHILADQINAEHLKANSVTSDKIIAEAITSDKIQANSITSSHILADAITADKIASNVITTEHLQANSISTEKLQAGIINAEHINSNSINADHIKADSITSKHLSTGSITADAISSGAITTDKLDANSITADKLQANSIEAYHLTLGELITNTAQIKTGLIENAHIKDATITSAKIGEGQIGSAHITEASILSGHLSNASITNAHIKDATIEDAKIANVNANKINAGTINTGKVTISDTSGILRLVGNKLQIFDNSEVPVERVRLGEYEGNYGLVVRGRDGQTVLYDENGVYSAGITDGAITNEKVNDGAIDSRTLNIDELFVGDNAFINSLHALEIDAGQISTGKIKNELIDMEGIVSFSSLNKELADNFIKPEGSNQTWINGGSIYADSITADKINLKGLSIQKDGYTTLNISENGDVTLSGEIVSNNYNNLSGFEAGYRITPDGQAVFNDAILRGSVMLPQAGITNESNIRFYAGTDFNNKENAPFKVFNDGSIEALKGYFGGTFTGEINIGNIHITDTNETDASFVINSNDDDETLIALKEQEAKFNVDFNINDQIKYSKAKSNLEVYSDTIFASNPNTKLFTPKEPINLRLSASWSGDIYRMARPGELITVLEINDAWCKLYDNGVICYAPLDYLEEREINKGKVVLNNLDQLEYNALEISNISGGIHRVTNKLGNGGLDFIAEGNNQTAGVEEAYDFKFTRGDEEEAVSVVVNGELTVNNRIKMHPENKVEMVSIKGSNSGIDFMVR